MPKGPSRNINLLKFHRPRFDLKEAPVPKPSKESEQCLRNLSAYRAPNLKMKFPRSRCAAVLVALFIGRMGDLYVLLSRRSANLRSYAGDTSLPGGKVEPGDETFEDTARREAYEEIGLPMDKEKVPLLCVAEPFLASNSLIVTPVVVLILDNTLRPILNASEVASLFSHPLASFLTSAAPFPSESEMFEVEYHTYRDIDWNKRGRLRVHSFLTGREAGGIKPVFGLTAGILIRVATIGYRRKPDFEVSAPDEPTKEERLAFVMLCNPDFRRAFEAEGIDPDYKDLDRLLRRKEAQRLGRTKKFKGQRSKL